MGAERTANERTQRPRQRHTQAGGAALNLMHEVWREPDGCTMLVLSGSMGEDARQTLASDSQLLHTFSAGSHVEAMQTYYGLMDCGKYTTAFGQDYELYPVDWLSTQANVRV